MQQLAFCFVVSRTSGLRPYQGKGQRNGRAQLTDEIIRRIRRRNPSNPEKYAEKASALSKELGVCEKNISLIRRRIRWSHVND